MTDDQLAEAQSVFEAVSELPREEREAFLSRRCSDDRELRDLVERLLVHHDGGIGAFLEPPDAGSEQETASPGPLPQRIGPYEVIRKLGEGGMGTVYLARQEKPRRTVALKVVRLHSADAATLRRFDFEIEVLGQLNHPGIAQIYEAGTDTDGTPFFAMEYVPGEPLRKHVQSRGLGHRDRLELLARVCDAVHYAHEKGVIHRDLKPGNILVAGTEGAAALPKILDFGVARAIGARFQADSGHTRTGTLVGTLAYMSPEQVSGRSEELDERSDVYQLGVILFELLTGRLPYEVDGLSVTEAIQVIKETESPELGSLDTRFRGDITTIVGRALEKDPRRRYVTAAELAADIRHHLADEPITARPPSATYRIRKFIKRRKSFVLTLGMGLMVVAAVAALWLAGQNLGTPSEIRATRIVAEDYTAIEVFFAMSPDGQSVVCAGRPELILVAVGTGEARTLVENEPGLGFHWVDWHPDGKRVLTEECRGDHYETWLTDVVTGRRELIRETPERTCPAVSPDGDHLAFLWNACHEIRIVSIDGGESSTVVQVEEPEELSPPVWAIDGSRLAYTVLYTPSARMRSTLETTDLSGNRSPLLEDDDINRQAGEGPRLCWLPDGRLVYNKLTGQAGGELVVVDVDIESGQLRQGPRRFFGMDSATLGRPSASADGKRMAFARDVWDRRPMVLEVNDGAPEPKVHPVCLGEWVARPNVWSRDGQRIFLDTERKVGDMDIYVRDFNARREEPFVVTPESEVTQCLTPDGSHLLYLQDQALMSIPVTGGNSRRILRVEQDYRGTWIRCATTPDSMCLIVEFDGAAMVVRPFHLDGSVDTELMRIDVDTDYGLNVGFDLSPDASQFVVTEWFGRIRVFDLNTGEARELPNEWGGNPQRVSWSRNGAFLYVSGMNGPARYWIVRMNLDGTYEVLYESWDTWAGWPVASPDDRRVAFGTIQYRTDIWMIENF